MLYDNYLKAKHGIAPEDNYAFRQLLQQKGPELHQTPQPIDGPCGLCDSTMNLSEIN
jgi:hypothetical protein